MEQISSNHEHASRNKYHQRSTGTERSLQHITLATGERSELPRQEVAEEVIEGLTPWLQTALAAEGPYPFPFGSGEYCVSAEETGGGLLMSLHATSKDVPILVMGVAQAERGQELWNLLTDFEGVSYDCPTVPWCAVSLQRVDLIWALPAMNWLCNFERCIAETWLESNTAAAAMPDEEPVSALQVLARGESYPREIPGEGAYCVFHPSGIEIVVAIPTPDNYEIESFKAGHATKIGFAKWDRLGILLIDFGQGHSLELPFDAGIEMQEDIPVLDLHSDSTRIALTLIGVDTADGNKVFGLRNITASPRVSRLLAKKIKEQITNPLDLTTYKSRCAELFARFPSARSIKKIALAYDNAGFEDAKASVADEVKAVAPRLSAESLSNMQRAFALDCVERFGGGISNGFRNKRYPSALPLELQAWHLYLADAGHSILVLPKCMQTEERRRKTCAASSLRPYLIFSISPDHECWASTDLRDFLVPACVKTVLRDYTIEDGLIVIDVQYDPMIGLVGGEGDEEF